MRSRVGVVAGEAGAALIMALLIVLLLSAIAGGLIALANTETAIAAAYRHAHEVTYAADAGVELALHDLSSLTDWSAAIAAPPANRRSPFVDRTMFPTAPDGSVLDLAALTSIRQRDSDAREGADVFGADNPQWRLYAFIPLSDVLARSLPAMPMAMPITTAYLVVWVADDGVDGDGDPAVDANGVLLVRAEAFGSRGARRAIEVAVSRAGNGTVRVLTWREVRA